MRRPDLNLLAFWTRRPRHGKLKRKRKRPRARNRKSLLGGRRKSSSVGGKSQQQAAFKKKKKKSRSNKLSAPCPHVVLSSHHGGAEWPAAQSPVREHGCVSTSVWLADSHAGHRGPGLGAGTDCFNSPPQKETIASSALMQVTTWKTQSE